MAGESPEVDKITVFGKIFRFFQKSYIQTALYMV